MPIAATVARPYLFHMLRSDQKRVTVAAGRGTTYTEVIEESLRLMERLERGDL